MAKNANYTVADYTLNISVASLSGSTVYVPVPQSGTLIETSVANGASVSGANLTLTVAVLPQGAVANVFNVGNPLVVPLSTPAGEFTGVQHTSPRNVNAGDVIRVTPSAGTSAGFASFSFRIRR